MLVETLVQFCFEFGSVEVLSDDYKFNHAVSDFFVPVLLHGWFLCQYAFLFLWWT